MKKSFKHLLCFVLCLSMLLSTGAAAYATASEDNTPPKMRAVKI